MTMQASGTDGFTFPDNTTQKTAFAPGMRNKIINGAMMIDQRNAGAAVTVTGIYSGFPVDRFKVTSNTTGSLSFQRSTNAPAGLINSLNVTVTASDSAPAVGVWLEQDIEGLNCADLDWGTANAKTVTFSFWVRSSLTGTFGGSLENSANNRSYPFSYSISAANTWEQKIVTVSGDTTGTWLTTNGIGLRLIFDLGLTASLRGTAGAWASADYRGATGATSVVGTNGATFYITGVQLEKGSVATPFENRLYGTELALCQRYCINYNSANSNGAYNTYGVGWCVSTTGFRGFISFPVQMRAIPSLTVTAAASNYALYTQGIIIACSAVPTITINGVNLASASFNGTVASGLIAGQGAELFSNNNNTSYFLFTAEL